ncbi:hypothetical protein P154DRAFT_581864 [Amniculicola lignicola CBS 123094]|uniref:Uncharacterized protein n=1 Tax=Amniculicola lignicola CBS 123094 TaxID=1392246 RepID=A0A6A5W085_9PLEO|nr:hypothetical protein P154DRAFT_581864 [Amniculicola lignicola CBS 123094]
MLCLEQLAYDYSIVGSLRTGLLLCIIQFNFVRALMENTNVLGLTPNDLEDESISLFNNNLGLGQLDLLLFLAIRDNFIRADDTYDDEELCHAIMGHGSIMTGKTGIIVWRDPWDLGGVHAGVGLGDP